MVQPHKGDRVLLGTRVPRAAGQEVRSRARALGLPASEYLAQLILEHLSTTELPEHADGELLSRREVATLSRTA